MAFKRTRKDYEADLQKPETPFVFYGTPLPPLDDDTRDDGSYVPVWKQEVTDDRGRKRLHGAFTGGFSAGYFNTVGSKEGWTPSTFVSSRTNRAKNAQSAGQQKPEDFMDEEDIREQEETQHLQIDQGFEGFGTADDANHRDALMDLFAPAESTMGEQMLAKMGWKKGQGIGPKIKRRVDSENEDSGLHLFAPEDVPMISFVKKTDRRGLTLDNEGGSATTLKLPATTSNSRSLAESDDEEGGRETGVGFSSRKKKKSKQNRGAFGVGILNDTGSDEEDPYSIGPKISYNKTLGGSKKSKKASSTNTNPLLKHKPVFLAKRLASVSNTLRKCYDGNLPLDGFVLADELDTFAAMSLNDDKYRPPVVPEGWKPARAAVLESASDLSNYESTIDAAKSSTLTSSSRGSLLGESALPGKSVFDYLTPAAREKLVKASGKTNLPAALGEVLPGSTALKSHSTDIDIPSIDPKTALQALSRMLNGGFTPYASDVAKSARYKSYLESQANDNSSATTTNTTPPLLPLPPAMTKSEHETELREFARTAEVFQPVSGLMASRFTTSTTSQLTPGIDDDDDDDDDDKNHNQSNKDPSVHDLLTRPTRNKSKDPAEQAASMGMFGHLTRSVTNFYPTRLLCKRFGVEMPVHADTPQPPPPPPPPSSAAWATTDPLGGTDANRFRSAGFQQSEKQNIGLGNVNEGEPGVVRQVAVEEPIANPIGDGRVDPDRNEALERERPGAAVFRAIFGSDDDDDDEGDDG